jgi:TonB family protein
MILIATLVFGLVATPTAAQETAEAIPLVQVRIGNGEAVPNGIVRPPQALSYTYPEYTDEARDLGIEGTVTVEAEFDTQGNFEVLRIVKTLGFGLDERALEALANWRFVPAQRNGALVGAVAQIDIGFNLLREQARLLREGAFRIGEGVSVPTIVSRIDPTYSQEAREERLQGTVALEAVVLEDGSARVVSLIRGLGLGLDENAVQALERWTFEPSMKDGKAVKIALTIEVNFNLR